MFTTKEKVERLRLLSVRAGQIYNYYTSLFIDERLDLLEQHGGSFFALVQVELEEALALKLAKLTDPAQQGKSNKNFTLETILKIAHNESWQCKDQLQSCYDTDVEPKRRLIKKYRDKYLSHLDYGSTLNSSLTLPELAELEALLKSIEDFIKLAYAATHQAD